jgi:hypothetical protein
MIQNSGASYRVDRISPSKWLPAAITISYANGSLRCKQKHPQINKNYVASPIHLIAWLADEPAFSCRLKAYIRKAKSDLR